MHAIGCNCIGLILKARLYFSSSNVFFFHQFIKSKAKFDLKKACSQMQIFKYLRKWNEIFVLKSFGNFFDYWFFWSVEISYIWIKFLKVVNWTKLKEWMFHLLIIVTEEIILKNPTKDYASMHIHSHIIFNQNIWKSWKLLDGKIGSLVICVNVIKRSKLPRNCFQEDGESIRKNLPVRCQRLFSPLLMTSLIGWVKQFFGPSHFSCFYPC